MPAPGWPLAEPPSELLAPVDLCWPDGSLNPAAVGWTRRPLHRCGLPGRWPRRKRWHHWCVASPREIVAMTFADLDYLGLASVLFVDLDSGRSLERLAVRPLGWGLDLPDTAQSGGVEVDRWGVRLSFSDAPGGVRLEARARGLRAELDVHRPPEHETLGVVIPWSDREFQYTSKQNAMVATGSLIVDGERRALAAPAFACLDFGRGVWPRSTSWNWASASGLCGGKLVGFNLGARWTDGTGLNENALCVDGRLSKIDSDVAFFYDRSDPRRPWSIIGPAVRLRFTPLAPRRLRVPLVVARASLDLCFGRFEGEALGQRIDGLIGWAEEFHARW